MIEFHKTADATTHAKKLCRENGLPTDAVNSRYLPDAARFRTRICLPDNPEGDARAILTAALEAAGYHGVAVEDDVLRTVVAFSSLTGSTHDPVAELARRALVELIPESYSADEVSAMPDSEAIQFAVANGLLEG